MSIKIPIVSEFDEKGIKRAVAEFEKLEGAGEKAQFLIQKAALPAAAALTGLAAAGAMATKAAAEDAKAQELLALTLRNSTGATDAQIAANEQYIATTERSAAVADDQLRPALANLVRATGDVTQSQQLLNVALDISAATGKDLESVSIALAKASDDQFTALKKLGVPLDENIIKTKDFEGAISILSDTFGGAAATAADTFEGKMRKVQIALDNTKENIGKALIPVLEKLLPYLDRAAIYMENNTDKIVAAGGAIGSLSTGVLAANGAFKLYNGAVLIANGLTATLGGVSLASAANVGTLSTKLGLVGLAAFAAVETFRNLSAEGGLAFKQLTNYGVDFVNIIIAAFEKLAEGVNYTINSLIMAYNKILPGTFLDVGLLPTDINLGRFGMPFDVNGKSRRSNVPDRLEAIPSMAEMVPFAAPDIIPQLTPTGGGGGKAGKTGGGLSISPAALDLPLYTLPDLAAYGQLESARLADIALLDVQPSITVNVNGGLSTSAEVGQAVVNALRSFNRQQGAASISVAPYV